jgi:hypothetical protein
VVVFSHSYIGTSLDLNFRLLAEEMECAHVALTKAIAQLAHLTAGAPPARGVVVETRWNISSASLARRSLWHRILAELSNHRFDPVRADIRLLEDADMELIRRSCAHVARWNIDAVMRDWAGYRVASKVMREKMTAAMEKERAVLSTVFGGG